MDLDSYALHLTTGELDYELELRGVVGLTNRRVKTAALLECMRAEERDEECAPKNSGALDVRNEIGVCTDVYRDVMTKADEAIASQQPAELARCTSRLYHVQMRLERVSPITSDDSDEVDELLDNVYDALHRIAREKIDLMQPKRRIRATSAVQPVRALDNESRRHSAMPDLSIRDISAGISALSFDVYAAEEGAIGGNRNPRDSLVESDLLTRDEQNQIADMVRVERERREGACRMPPVLPHVRDETRRDRESILSVGFRQPNLRQSRTRSPPPKSSGPDRNAEHTHFNDRQNTADMYRRDNFPVHDRPRPSFLSERNNAEPPRIFESVREPHRAHYTTRKTVPINQWKITFSGDGYGLHLYDFLSQVELLQRAESVSDGDMNLQVIHLLSGRARMWYLSCYDRFGSWSQLVAALKREFLPANYDFQLFGDISNRVQKEHESFGEYFTHMLALFKCLSIPLDESYKLFLVQKNLRPKYATAIAPLEIRNLDELNGACRRIDNAASAQGRSIFSMPCQNWETRDNQVAPRSEAREVFAVQAEPQRRTNPFAVPSTRKCWNCQETGHTHRECKQARRAGIFCYRCGERDVLTANCRKCSPGNGAENPTVSGPVRDSPDDAAPR